MNIRLEVVHGSFNQQISLLFLYSEIVTDHMASPLLQFGCCAFERLYRLFLISLDEMGDELMYLIFKIQICMGIHALGFFSLKYRSVYRKTIITRYIHIWYACTYKALFVLCFSAYHCQCLNFIWNGILIKLYRNNSLTIYAHTKKHQNALLLSTHFFLK